MNEKVVFAVVGLGYWGPNIVRNISTNSEAKLKTVCDLDLKRLENIKKTYPSVETTSNVEEIAKDMEINAVVIVTPPETHYKLGKLFLEN
ncbi:MAG: Gfo/Idh/MocA family oxidoreductase, partial [Candidatus Nanoarchaeia archaeon]